MTEPTDTPRWLAAATDAFGQPHLAIDTDIRMSSGGMRRCWLWWVAGRNFNIAIDTWPNEVRAAAVSPGRRAQLWGTDEPTDAEIQAMCAYAWPDYRPDGGDDA